MTEIPQQLREVFSRLFDKQVTEAAKMAHLKIPDLTLDELEEVMRPYIRYGLMLYIEKRFPRDHPLPRFVETL